MSVNLVKSNVNDSSHGSKIINGDSAHVSEEGFIKSPINYTGGKYRLLSQILPLFPQDIGTFLDLFCGSATVGINCKQAKRVIFNDINYRLIEIFQKFQELSTNDIIDKIHKNIDYYKLSKTNRNGFLSFRNAYNMNPDPIDLYTLVAFSFNYQFRFNNKMQYNNPFGKNRSCYSARMEKNLIKFINRLHEIDAVFSSVYFNKINTSDFQAGDFVYADPPYLITTGSYNDGTRGFGDWTETQDKELMTMLDGLNDNGIRFAMSNVLTHKGKKNEQLLDWINKNKYNIHHLNFNYNNSSYNTKHGETDEVLITNY